VTVERGTSVQYPTDEHIFIYGVKFLALSLFHHLLLTSTLCCLKLHSTSTWTIGLTVHFDLAAAAADFSPFPLLLLPSLLLLLPVEPLLLLLSLLLLLLQSLSYYYYFYTYIFYFYHYCYYYSITPTTTTSATTTTAAAASRAATVTTRLQYGDWGQLH